MSRDRHRPAWQLPPGVSKGAWDYVTQPDIADDYDVFHDGHPLLALDRALVLETANALKAQCGARTPIALDLGCGTGRTLLPLAERGWNVMGVDLSRSMLACTATKLDAFRKMPESRLALAQGNLAQLDFLKDACIDLATCLYSSLGMVQGRRHRRSMLANLSRALHPQGRLVVHAHNRGIWVRDPGGMARALREWVRSLHDKHWEFGDRVYPYRGLPSMFLHIYSERELRSDLRAAHLHVESLVRLNLTSSGPLKWSSILSGVRAGGFLVVARPARALG